MARSEPTSKKGTIIGHGMVMIDKEDPDWYVLRQYEVIRDKEIWFGPCRTTLYHLIAQGFILKAAYNPRWMKMGVQKKIPLRLERGIEKYVVSRRRIGEFLNSHDLGGFVKDGADLINYVSRKSVPVLRETPIKPKTPQPPEVKEPDIVDPWTILKQKYPEKPKGFMMGNMTLREYIMSELDSADA